MALSPQEAKIWVQERKQIVDRIDATILKEYENETSEVRVSCSYSDFCNKDLCNFLQNCYEKKGWQVNFICYDHEVSKSQYFITLKEKPL